MYEREALPIIAVAKPKHLESWPADLFRDSGGTASFELKQILMAAPKCKWACDRPNTMQTTTH